MIWMLSQHLVVCGLLAVLVGTICRVFALSPATRHTLWFIVLLKVLLPLPVTWPWGIPTPSALFAKPASVLAAPTSGAPPIQIPRMPQELVVATNNAAAQAAPVAIEAKPSRIFSAWVWLDASRAAGLIWAMVSVAVIGGQSINHARFRRRMRSHKNAPEWLAAGVAEIAQRLGIDHPEVHVVDGAPSPCVYGLLKTKLIVPVALLTAVPRERWQCILTHELAHLKRRDHLVRWVELVTGGIWFWNPVYWIARRNLRANAELACDTWVVWALPDQRRVYAETLIDVSEFIAKSPQPIAALGMGARGVRLDFERRLKMILHERNAQRMTWKAAAFAVLLAIIAMPGWSQNRTPVAPAAAKQEKVEKQNPTAESRPQPENGNEIQAALKSPVNIKFKDVHIAKIVDFLAEFLGVNIVVDQGAVKPETYKGIQWQHGNAENRTYATDGMLKPLDVKAAKGSEVLDEWMKQQNLAYTFINGMLFISSKEQIQKDAETLPVPPIGAVNDSPAAQHASVILGQPLEWTYESVHIAAAADALSRKIKLPIIVDARIVAPPVKKGPPTPSYAVPFVMPSLPEDPERDRLYATDGVVRAIELKDVPLETALKALTEPLNLVFVVKGPYIWITSSDRQAAQDFQYPPVPSDAQELGKALESPINIEFETTHVTKILDFLRDFMGINIVVDQRALPAVEAARHPNPPYLTKVDDKYVPTGYVAYIKLEDTALRDALNALLVPLGLTYRVDRNAIFVSSPELIDAHAEAAPVAAQPAREDSALARALNAPINVEFEGQHISKILEFIGDYLSVSFAMDFRAVKPVRVTPAVAGQPGLPAFPPGPGAPSPAPGAPQLLPPPVVVPDEPLDPIVEAMFVTDGIVPYVKLQDMSLKEALNALLEPLNLAYEVRPNYFWITAKERIGTEDWSDPLVPENTQVLVEKLNSPVVFEIEDQHIITSLGFIAKFLELDIEYDSRAVPPLREGVAYFEAKDGKPVSTGLFPHIRLKDVPFKETLKALLTPMGLTYVVTPDHIVITSPELARTTKPEEWASVPYISDGV